MWSGEQSSGGLDSGPRCATSCVPGPFRKRLCGTPSLSESVCVEGRCGWEWGYLKARPVMKSRSSKLDAALCAGRGRSSVSRAESWVPNLTTCLWSCEGYLTLQCPSLESKASNSYLLHIRWGPCKWQGMFLIAKVQHKNENPSAKAFYCMIEG